MKTKIIILLFWSICYFFASAQCSVTVVEKTVCQNDTVHLIFTGVPPFNLNYTFNGIRKNITVSGMDTILIATQAGENQFITHYLMSGNGSSIGSSDEDGVEINGVV